MATMTRQPKNTMWPTRPCVESEYLEYMRRIQDRILGVVFKHDLGVTDILIEWIFDCTLEHKCVNPRTFHLATYITYKYPHEVKLSQLQKLACAAIMLSHKHSECYAPDAHDMRNLTKNTYTALDIAKFEREVFGALDYSLEIALVMDFVDLRKIDNGDALAALEYMASLVCLDINVVKLYKQEDIANVLLHIALTATRCICDDPVFDLKSDCYQAVLNCLVSPTLPKTAAAIKNQYGLPKHQRISQRLSFSPAALVD